MEPVHISYRIKLNAKVTEVFDFALDGKTFELLTEKIEDPPHWTALNFRQCSNCPLSLEKHPHCPMALQLHSIVQRLDKTRSIDEVEVEVTTEERRVCQTTALQRVIASMLGLVFPTCGCPKTAYLRPMARFHLPLASEEETVFRVTGMYLLAQYFLHNTGTKGQFDFEGLIKIYEDLHILNTAMTSRLQAATRSDTSFNAVTLLDMYATLVPMLLEDQLVEMRGFFGAFLPADAPIIKTKHNYLEKAKAFTLELIPIEEKDENKGSAIKPVSGFSKESIAAAERKKAVFVLPDDEPVKKPVSAAQAPEKSSASTTLSLEPLSLSLEPLGSQKPAGKATFVLPDDEPPPSKTNSGIAAKNPVDKKEESGGLKTVDFKPGRD